MLLNKTLCRSDYFPLIIFPKSKITGGFTGRCGNKLVGASTHQMLGNKDGFSPWAGTAHLADQ